MSPAIAPTTGVDGVKAGGNTPVWIVQNATITIPLTAQSTSFPLTALSAESTVKADCLMNMDGYSMSRTATTTERQRMCEAITVKRKTGETIEGELTALFDQQATSSAIINAVYTAMPENATVYIAQAFGLAANAAPTAKTKVDVYRVTVTQRNKNQPVAGEDLMFTASLSADLYLQDVTLA